MLGVSTTPPNERRDSTYHFGLIILVGFGDDWTHNLRGYKEAASDTKACIVGVNFLGLLVQAMVTITAQHNSIQVSKGSAKVSERMTNRGQRRTSNARVSLSSRQAN